MELELPLLLFSGECSESRSGERLEEIADAVVMDPSNVLKSKGFLEIRSSKNRVAFLAAKLIGKSPFFNKSKVTIAYFER